MMAFMWPYFVWNGTTSYGGGAAGSGTVFRIDTDGMHFTNLHNFSAYVADPSLGPYADTNSDGANPQAPLLLSGNVLYGTTSIAGPNGTGTVFRINTDGTGFSNVCGVGSANFYSPVVRSSNTLYWTASTLVARGEHRWNFFHQCS